MSDPIEGDADLTVNVQLSARVGVRNYFATEHLYAAQLMADRCRRRENDCIAEGISEVVVDYEIRSYASACIMQAVAFLEARVNELWQDAIDTPAAGTDQRLKGLEPSVVELLRRLGDFDRLERALSLLDRYNVTLACAGMSGLDTGRSPGQDVKALIDLRNALVHFKPEIQWGDTVHRLESRLKHLVPANPLMRNTSPWFPHHPLCAGVAEWACETSRALVAEWEQQLGLTHTATDLSAFPPVD